MVGMVNAEEIVEAVADAAEAGRIVGLALSAVVKRMQVTLAVVSAQSRQQPDGEHSRGSNASAIYPFEDQCYTNAAIERQRIRRKATEDIHTVLRFRWFIKMIYIRNASSYYMVLQCRKAWARMEKELTPSMAGSSGTCGGFGGWFSLGGSSILKSLTSLPRKTIYSYTVSEGGTSFSGSRPSVPQDTTFSSATVEFSELISWSVPT